MPTPIYLDHNATSPLAPEVAEVMAQGFAARYANPSSQHEPGRVARRVLQQAKQRIAELLGADISSHPTDQLILTSGGTEANNLALRGLAVAKGRAERRADSPPPQLILSAIEHPSIAAVADQMALEGWQVDRLPVDRQGVVDVEQLRSMLSPQTQLAPQARLVSVMLGNNETGVLQPITEIAAACRTQGVVFHTDAVQAVGKIDVQFGQLGVTALSLTAHKFGGPRGVGGLLLKRGTTIKPLFYGGFQQSEQRPGTESVVLALGFCKAMELWHAERERRTAMMMGLRNRLEQQILSGAETAVVVGESAPRLPHTSNIAFVGLDRQAMVMALDLAGIACSTGSACASGSSEPSPVLLAMGCDEGVVGGSIRLSLGSGTTEAEIDEATQRILLVYKQLRSQKEP